MNIERPDRLSFAKDKISVLLLEGISRQAIDTLQSAGYSHISYHEGAMNESELIAAIQGVHFVGIRSRTKITEAIVMAGDRLRAIGCFSVGTNQVDLNVTQNAGIPVFNAPFSNTRSVAELTIAEIVMLYRGVFSKSVGAHAGRWMKSAEGSNEIRGKILGIVGYGNIGSQLATLAEAMGMRVVYYDHTEKLSHGNVEPIESLDDLMTWSDVVSLHLPDTPATRGLISAREIELMKPGSFLINNARGNLIDLDALATALRDGHLAGAAVDVFPVEPTGADEALVTPLQGLDNVILTPHVGGSTREAQNRIGSEVAKKLIEFSDVGSTVGAVNFPNVQLPSVPETTRFIQVQRNEPGELRRLNDVFARHDINIAAQHYDTDHHIGYVVLDAAGIVDNVDEILQEIRGLPGTIQARTVLSPKHGV